MTLPVVDAFCSCGWSISCDADSPRQIPADHEEKQSWMDCPNWQPDAPITPTILAARIASRLVVEHRKSHKMKLNTGGLSKNRIATPRALRADDESGEGVGSGVPEIGPGTPPEPTPGETEP